MVTSVIEKEDLDNPLIYIPKYFKVETKKGELLPMNLWRCQKHYIENRTHRDIILKGRQMGMTTGIQAANTHRCFTKQHLNMAIITHEDQLSQFLLLNLQRFHDNLPKELRDENVLRWKSASRKYFPKTDVYIYVDSANSEHIGIGHTMHIAHLSEVAKFPDRRARSLYAGISQTVPRDGYLTLESTPQGRLGIFYELYQAAKEGEIMYKPFFYPWWWNDDYEISEIKELKTDERAKYAASVLGMSLDKFISQESQMMEDYHVTPKQIAWRREKIGELKELFFQEYPENDIDCWLSSEMSIIDGISLKPYYGKIQEGRQEGALTIWKDVVGGHKYVIGVDVASGSARDYTVASVLDTRNLEYVARYRAKIHTDLFGEHLFNLGVRYNQALVAVERIGHGHSVLRILLEKSYPNLYYHVDYDEIQKVNITDAGWKTSIRTKPLMINGMIAAFRSGDLLSYSENLLQEASGLHWEGGVDSKVKVAAGGNNDEFDAVAIALQVREQVPLSSTEKPYSVSQYAKVF